MPEHLHPLFPPPCITIDVAPLIESIASNNAIAFVGAGASMSAGLPSWQAFLSRCLNRARNSSPDKGKWDFPEKLLNDGEFLVAAELLQRGIGSQLERYIWDEFGHATTPSPVHTAIARIPFSTVITTNYDRLLESAYPTHSGVRTWLDAAAIFSALRHKRFSVIKTHGDVGNRPSLVLTKSDYRDITQESAFNSCLRMFLTLRTFLFVGYSLRDHDLLSLMDEARLMYGEDFGPHYSILFDDEVDDGFVQFLEDSYAIHTIICKSPTGNSEWTPHQRTAAIANILREISGRVAVRQLTTIPYGDSVVGSTFALDFELSRLLEDAIKLTGCFRGEVCMVQDSLLQSMKRVTVYPTTNTEGDIDRLSKTSLAGELPPAVPQIGDDIAHESVIGRVFLTTWLGEHDFAYISNTRRAKEQLHEQGFVDTRYQSCHPDVLSELACPILADGQRVGVINVEADREEALTEDHAHVVQEIATRMGASCIQLRHRDLVTSSLKHFHGANFYRFKKVMRTSRLLDHHDMQFILYEIDYKKGQLVAHYDNDRMEHLSKLQAERRRHGSRADEEIDYERYIRFGFHYSFEDKSLAALTFRERRAFEIADPQDKVLRTETQVSEHGLNVFSIKGPLVSMPVTVRGHVAGVLVAWSDSKQRLAENEFSAISDRVHRMAQLVANDPLDWPNGDHELTRSERFAEFVNEHFRRFDHGELWTSKMLRVKKFRNGIVSSVLSSLVHPCIGLTRARLWVSSRDSHGNLEYRINASMTRPGCSVNGKRDNNSYVGTIGNCDDPYVKYTQARYRNDPYARYQHTSMFEEPDVNQDRLDKDPDGKWIVGPIVRWNRSKGRETKKLSGYLSADSHSIDVSHSTVTKEVPFDDAMQVFQRCAVDIATDLLEEILTFERRDGRGKIPLEYFS